MSPKQLTAMRLLINAPAGLYASEMIALSEGRLSRGTTYILLQNLETDGMVSSEMEAPTAALGMQRPRYTATTKGSEAYQEFLREHIPSSQFGALS